MANDNNKNIRLVFGRDSDPTSPLETLSKPGKAELRPQVDSEVALKTFDFDRLAEDGKWSGRSVSALKSELQARTDQIDRLQFDIERLQLKLNGTEKEIRAREELTTNINRELVQTRRKLAHTEKSLYERSEQCDELDTRLRNKDRQLAEHKQRIAELDGKLQAEGERHQILLDERAAQASQIEELTAALDGSTERLTDLQQYVSGRDAAWQDQATELDHCREDIDRKITELDSLREEIEKRDAQIKQRDSDCARLSEVISTQQDDLTSLRESTKQMREQLRRDAAKRIDDTRRQAAEHAAALTRAERENDDLKNQTERIESYADALRVKLQQQMSLTDDATRDRKKMQASIADALEQVQLLKNELQEEQLVIRELTAKNSELKQSFAEEVRQVRFELSAAQETIADQGTINDQLKADLEHNQDDKLALEECLTRSTEDNDKKIRRLEMKQRNLQRQIEDYERKVKNKDSAIAALLNELAKRSEPGEDESKLEHIVTEIEGDLPELQPEPPAGRRSKVARMLVGDNDGQEIRFPLFKNKLTIGRTAQNDIQLKAQFISRRHAVIVTEQDCTRIVDWGSRNGVYVNRKRVTEQPLSNGDLVTIGSSEFRYEERIKR